MSDVRRLLKQARATRTPVAATAPSKKRAAAAVAAPSAGQRKQARKQQRAQDAPRPSDESELTTKSKPATSASVSGIAAFSAYSEEVEEVLERDELELEDVTTHADKRMKISHDTRETTEEKKVADAEMAEEEPPSGLPSDFFDAPAKPADPPRQTEAQLAAEYARFEAELAAGEEQVAAELEEEDEHVAEERERDNAERIDTQRAFEERVEMLRKASSAAKLAATKVAPKTISSQKIAVRPAVSVQKAFEDEDVEFSYDDDEEEDEEDVL
ncbi:hypothetical protein DFJ77DRAFT_119130 [Powellomyces hirtus]|nr:hypothetical protein DFJ77DRAFT_119130 [Powellomyces hirtus]